MMASPREVPDAMDTPAAGGQAPSESLDSSGFDWRRHRKYFLFMMFVAYFLNSVDRNIMTILTQSIKGEFRLMDWQMGMMTGFAFALFYNIIGIPTARLIDGGAIRMTIISGGIALWSVATAMCGVAQNYWQLLFARAGVGVGEGTFGPSAVTLISDFYTKNERARAIALYLTGLPMASLIGLSAGGWIAHEYGWRAALMVVGLPGLAVALIMKLTIKEPPRGLADGKVQKIESALSIREVFRTVTKKKTVVFLLLAASFASFSTVGAAVWLPPYLQRAFGLNVSQLGFAWGPLSGIAGATGSVVIGFLCDKFGKDSPKYYMLLPAFAMGIAFPFFILAALSGNFWLTYGLLLVPMTLNNSWIPAALASTQGLAPIAMRALLGMFVTFAANLVGHGFAPPIIGALSDLYGGVLNDSAAGLRWALITTSLLYPLAAVSFWMASRNIQNDLEK